MRIFIYICDIVIPLIMITIGILYRHNLYKKINKIRDLFIPISMLFSGVWEDSNKYKLKNSNTISSVNKRCSFIWLISGISTLLLTAIIIVLNLYEDVNDISFLDINNVSILLLELEFSMVVGTLISEEYILKKESYKKQ